jgi:hypothetical protein
MSITFSTSFYILKSKFDCQQYLLWFQNFISIVNNFNLVIYTDNNTFEKLNFDKIIDPNNKKIKIIIKCFEDFNCHKYKDNWIANHEKFKMLSLEYFKNVDWKLNMLWNEKIYFVNETIKNKYFDTEFYGWCDVGYFRNGVKDLNTNYLTDWCNESKIKLLEKEKIYYACINNQVGYIKYLTKLINDKNIYDLPKNQIPSYQNSIGGGFFIIHKDKIDWWYKTYYTKLKLYFIHDYFVKDDQLILADCIFSKNNINHFNLIREKDSRYDNWFLFQRFLQ